MNKLITVKELSEILSVKPKTIYQWVELGQIPCIKLNGTVRFDLEDIKVWIDSCKRGYNNGAWSRSALAIPKERRHS
jgi:excisionase family DNA binding protein